MTYRKCTFPLLTLSTHVDLAHCAMEWPSLISVALMDVLTRSPPQVVERLAKHSTPNGFLNVHIRFGSSIKLFPGFTPIVDGKSTWSAKPARQHYHVKSTDISGVVAFVKSVSEETIIDVLASIATTFTDLKLLELIVQDRNIHQASIALPGTGRN